jgi:hypothetical protein
VEPTDRSPQEPAGAQPSEPSEAPGPAEGSATEEPGSEDAAPLEKPGPPHHSAGVLGVIILLLAVLMIAGSVAAEVHYAHIVYYQLTARQWPIAEARIQSVQDGWGIRGGRWVFVTYTYDVADRTFQGSSRDLPHYSNAELRVASAAGRTLPIHYRPDHPEISVLDPGLTWKRILFFIPLLAMTFVGIMILAMAVMARFRPERFDLALAALPDEPEHGPGTG